MSALRLPLVQSCTLPLPTSTCTCTCTRTNMILYSKATMALKIDSPLRNSKKTSKKCTRDKKHVQKCTREHPRAKPISSARARCTSARETLRDDRSRACAQCQAGVFRISRASRRKRRSCPKSRFATIAYPSRGREHEREIPGLASSALKPGTRWCKRKSV